MTTVFSGPVAHVCRLLFFFFFFYCSSLAIFINPVDMYFVLSFTPVVIR